MSIKRYFLGLFSPKYKHQLNILSIEEWAKKFDINTKEWLLLGKGPSFSEVGSVNLSQYFSCSLNHVVREIPVTLAHMIDIDVVLDCANDLEKNAQYLIIPYYPHKNSKPTSKSIFEYILEIPILEKFARSGRLVAYNLSTSNRIVELGGSAIPVKFFSAEAALNILVRAKVSSVRSLGVDGGNTYSNKFHDLNEKTLLVNGQDSFSKQFKGMAKTIRQSGIHYSPLNIESPVRVFVGSDSAQMAGVKVLEYSIKKFASMSVEVQVIDDFGIPVPLDPANRSRTGFSFSRFKIPELCGYKGRAIYLDADMQLFTDIKSLWEVDFCGANILYAEQPTDKGRIPQFSVMILDCENLKWDVKKIVSGLDNGSYDYKQLMSELCIVPEKRKLPKLPFEWNSLEFYSEGETCLIHYTDMPTQPWVSNKNKNGDLWYRCLREAISEGFIDKEFIFSEIRKGNISPRLLKWAGLETPKEILDLYEGWTPPFRRFARAK